MTYDVLAIGNPVYDIIITPYVRSRGRVLSGCSVNASLTLRRLGFKRIALVGTIGRNFLDRFKRELRRYGISNFAISVTDETGGFELIYDEEGNRELHVLGIAGKISFHDIPDEYLDVRYILLGPILDEIDYSLVEYLSSTTKAEIFLDPQGLTRIVIKGRVQRVCDRKYISEIVKLVKYVKPNEIESYVITGIRDPLEAAKTLVAWGAEVGIVTLAERGSVAYDGTSLYRIPAYRTMRAVDPTGAGDVYAGAFIAKRLEGGSIASACLFASATASIKVEHCGPEFSIKRKDVEERYKAIAHEMDILKG